MKQDRGDGVSRRGLLGAIATIPAVATLGAQSAFDIEFIHNGESALPEEQRELLLYTKQNILALDIKAKIMTIELPIGLLESVDKPA